MGFFDGGDNGNAAQAIQHYQRALGAVVEATMRLGDMPDTKAAPPTATASSTLACAWAILC